MIINSAKPRLYYCQERHDLVSGGIAICDLDERRSAELAAILDRFSSLIKIQICKFNPGRFGIDPEDICQEIRIKLWRVLSFEKEITNFPSYLKKVVSSSVIDTLRKLKRDDGIILHEKQSRISEMKADYRSHLSAQEPLREKLTEAVGLLIESRRRVVKLYLMDLTIEEIAAFYGWSKNKTRNLLYRGLADLKRLLQEKDVEYEDE
jgi:RNA polymerase sigma factor (sigma-70 family)